MTSISIEVSTGHKYAGDEQIGLLVPPGGLEESELPALLAKLNEEWYGEVGLYPDTPVESFVEWLAEQHGFTEALNGGETPDLRYYMWS